MKIKNVISCIFVSISEMAREIQIVDFRLWLLSECEIKDFQLYIYQ